MPRTSDARERLLDSAAVLFNLYSFESVGVRELCEHAGVRKGTFYHFYSSKEELAMLTLERAGSIELQTIRSWADLHRNSRAAIGGYFRDTVRRQRAFRRKYGGLPGSLLNRMAGETAGRIPMLSTVAARETAACVRAIARVLGRGKRTPRTQDARRLAEMLFSAWEGAHLTARVQHSEQPYRMALYTIETLLRQWEKGPRWITPKK